jgi:kumamolisin
LNPRPFRRWVYALAAPALLAGALVPSPSFAARNITANLDVAPRIAGVHDLGEAGRGTNVKLALALGYRHADELRGLIEQQGTPHSPLYHHFLTSAQFNAYYAPSVADYARVAAALRAAGFTTHTYANRTLIDATGPAAVAERYFKTTIHRVSQDGYGLRYANVAPATLPAELTGTVFSVVGLDNLMKAHFTYEFGHRNPFDKTKIGPPLHGPDGGFGPLALANGFKFPVQKNFPGTGQAVANVAGDVLDSDLAAFETEFNINRTGQLLRTTIEQGSSNANVEATLDVETMGSLDPAADVHLYILSNPLDTPGEDAYNQIVTDNSVVAVNSSFGTCENQDPAYGKAAEAIIRQGNALGISWSASTGDGGAEECSGPQLLPAAIPEVTGAGGTSLTVSAKGKYVSQSAWDGGGGGVSTTYKIPSYQKGVSGLGSTTMRNLPDIAFPADPDTGYSFYYLGGWEGPIGGTSWSSPTYVALQAEIDEMQGARGGETNPTIYAAFAASGYKVFRDVTTGSNGFPAKTGYDNATGIGSIIGIKYGKSL